jgi:hypothetical protein
MANLWGRINADTTLGAVFTPPLVLPGSFTLANFNTALQNLRDAYLAHTTAVENARAVRSVRDGMLRPCRERLRQYRQVVKARLPAGHPLLATVPALSRPPGATPDPLNVTSRWDAVLGKAVLSWPAPAQAGIAHLSLRTAPGPTYRGSEESVVGDPLPAGALSVATDAGLSAPGSVALFRVYVVLATGNERGSATQRVVRPA